MTPRELRETALRLAWSLINRGLEFESYEDFGVPPDQTEVMRAALQQIADEVCLMPVRGRRS